MNFASAHHRVLSHGHETVSIPSPPLNPTKDDNINLLPGYMLYAYAEKLSLKLTVREKGR
jgi:hypothetical protein